MTCPEVLAQTEQVISHAHLQRNVRFQLKWDHLFTPRSELLSFRVDEVVKDCALRGEFHCSHLFGPPAAELCPVVVQLQQRVKDK